MEHEVRQAETGEKRGWGPAVLGDDGGERTSGHFLAEEVAHYCYEKISPYDAVGELGAHAVTKAPAVPLPGEGSLTTLATERRASEKDILRMFMIISHDIRSPLFSVLATLSMIRKGAYGQVDPKVKTVLEDTCVRVQRLLGASEDFLGKASMVNDTLRMEFTLLDLKQDVIDPVIEEFRTEIESRKIIIKGAIVGAGGQRVQLNGNAVMLKIVYRNLIGNAIKYGGRERMISLGLKDLGFQRRFNVMNTGEPIPAGHRSKLFKRFSRLGNTSDTNVNGMGLGLFLAKEVIQQHGGDIWYEARPNGSNFVFTLPVSEPYERVSCLRKVEL